MQQGRVLLDDDYNEAERISDEDERRSRIAIIGPAGTSDDGFLVSNGRLNPLGEMSSISRPALSTSGACASRTRALPGMRCRTTGSSNRCPNAPCPLTVASIPRVTRGVAAARHGRRGRGALRGRSRRTRRCGTRSHDVARTRRVGHEGQRLPGAWARSWPAGRRPTWVRSTRRPSGSSMHSSASRSTRRPAGGPVHASGGGRISQVPTTRRSASSSSSLAPNVGL